MIYFCCDKRRQLQLKKENDRRKGLGLSVINGIDFVEVLDLDAPAAIGGIQRQNTLILHLFEAVPAFTSDNVRIEGGERITPVRVIWASASKSIPASAAPKPERDFFAGPSFPKEVFVIRTDSTGDYSSYRLSLVKSPSLPDPPDDFDPALSAVDFSFKVECPSDFDCDAPKFCPRTPASIPPIDYLTKDYASFRRAMLDRIALLMPQWKERNAADLGVTLVELLAYVADRSSYRQDAIATEAYLDTARKRVSVRRHARLVDYFMHDGCNARTWVRLFCDDGTSGIGLPKGTPVLTKVIPSRPRLDPNSAQLDEAMAQRPTVFETMADLALFKKHESIDLYTWSDERCCLPKGATRATLAGHYPDLKVGDVVLFAEVVGPRTGDKKDADPTRRHAVRLTTVQASKAGGAPLTDPVTSQEITEISWDSQDRLPFPFCVSSITDTEHGAKPVSGVSVVWGNVVLADHGMTIRDENLGEVPAPTLFIPPDSTDRCLLGDPVPIPPRFQPTLQFLPLTQACRYDPTSPAAVAFKTSPDTALPQVELKATDPEGVMSSWRPRKDLLNSDSTATEFVAEVEKDGKTRLRLGDGKHGSRPSAGTVFEAAWYRTGNGSAGNIGPAALFHVVTFQAAVLGVTNPLPASGGVDSETMDEVRERAPFAFQVQQRAVTEADYAAKAELHESVQRAAATFRWTGSWHTVFVTTDHLGGAFANATDRKKFGQDVLAGLERYRMAGHDLEVDEPRFVSLEIEIHVCVDPGYFRSSVRDALLEILSNRDLPDGRRGVFHPDNFTFNQPVYLSPIYAAAQSIPGVESVQIITFQRQGIPSNEAAQKGVLEIDRLEIARCDNDPNFPEHGVLRLHLGGGK